MFVKQVILAALFSICAALASGESWTISGEIRDKDGQPVEGASVLLQQHGETIAGKSSDNYGRFVITWHAETLDTTAILRIHALGFLPRERAIRSDDLQRPLMLALVISPIVLEPVQVVPSHDGPLIATSYDKSTIREEAGRSAIPSNPLAALKAPNLAKVGSVHSSQIRIDGSSPEFTLNGVDIGSDPDHYGMFAIVPASIVERINFQSMGTDASFGSPSAVSLVTPARFSRHSEQELAVSTLDVTGTTSHGSDKFFVLGSARKSVLDILVDQIDVSSERRAIPPTNFLDLFMTSGFVAGSHWRFSLDQYLAMDKLSYTSQTPSQNNAISTFQLSNSWFTAARAKGLYHNIAVNLSTALSVSRREYSASPLDTTRTYSLFVDIEEHSTTLTQAADIRWSVGAVTLQAGHQLNRDIDQEVRLAQRNWNFLPPFANTDNPYIYQMAMNEAYGNTVVSTPRTQRSSFLASALELGKWRLESGVRLERWSDLASPASLLFRERLSYRITNNQSAELYAGTFAEHPISSVMEPYQVQIRANRESLKPIRTSLVSMSYRYNSAQMTVYHKRLEALPSISPIFELLNSQQTIAPSALPVVSNGTAQFTGVDASLDLRRIPESSFGFYGSYAYTKANKIEHGTELPLDLCAPHRVFLQGLFNPNAHSTLGVDFTVRSGYPYSPTRYIKIGTESQGYTADYYQSELSKENSYRFPTMMMVSFHGSVNFGSSSLTASVANITNRANPIIKSASGFVYDIGILPSLGFTWRF